MEVGKKCASLSKQQGVNILLSIVAALLLGSVLRTRVFGTSGLKFVSIGKCRKT